MLEWDEVAIQMVPRGHRNAGKIDEFHEECKTNIQEDNNKAEILNANYEKTNLEVTNDQKHLNEERRKKLGNILSQCKKLFNGKLGKYTKRKIHLELKPDAKPIHCKPYPVTQEHMGLFLDELQNLCDDGVLEKIGAMEHAYPTLIIAKKYGGVQWVSDFCKLNQQLKHKIYSLPKIQDILQ